ncbi:hypothetical protein NG819_03235 [Pseudarthrobacter sp. Fe7]|nr:hypothetical protein NG819_03235 [Pseudarthrobacter sp. Fe7]
MTSNLDPDARSSYRLITLAARLIQRRQDDALAPLASPVQPLSHWKA